ncbi:MAG: hypothetical protein AB3N14_10050 [Flavobacteriaceae bacterium]
MRRLIPIIGLSFLLISCGETTAKKIESETAEKANPSKEEANNTLPSADYSSLLNDYSCDMDIAELAKVLEIPETDLSIPDSAKEPVFAELGNCYFNLKGFGKYFGTEGTEINWGSTKMTKADIKKSIKSYLKYREEGLEKMMKMYIVEADTKDSYIATQLRYGRVIILNENYDNVFLIVYGMANKIVDNDDHSLVIKHARGTENSSTDRTTAQHKVLTEKMVKLANYLLKKHRK